MVLGILQVPGRPTIWIMVGQGHTALAVVAGLFGHFLSSIFSLFFLPLWETARYGLKYCLKGPLSPKLPTNQLNEYYLFLFYPITLEGRRGTTDEFATIPFHLDLFSAALVELAKSIPVHSLILSSHLFFCLPLFLFPFTVPCRKTRRP